MEYQVYFSLVVCLLSLAHADINPEDVTYVFFSKENRNGIFARSSEDPTFKSILNVFNPNLPSVFLIHGWQDNYESNVNTFVRDAVFTKTDANLMKIDWAPLSNQGYFAARDSVPGIGRMAATVIQTISQSIGYSLSNVTLVGFSLGAHIAGNIGKALNGEIGVIIGLDPAGPFIDANDVDYSLNPSDAAYVQVVHTNAGTLGMVDPVGDADFYPNGGSRQPGCGLDIIGNCAHNRAWEFFAESIQGNQFEGVQCAELADVQTGNCNGETRLMGGLDNLDAKAKGLFFLQTNAARPFGRVPSVE